jgi:hypothetical protein
VGLGTARRPKEFYSNFNQPVPGATPNTINPIPENSSIGGIGIKPPTSKDKDEYVRRCLEIEVNEEPEIRKWNSDPAFEKVLTQYNSQQFDAAIKVGKTLFAKYYDFDLIYHWIGGAYKIGRASCRERVFGFV